MISETSHSVSGHLILPVTAGPLTLAAGVGVVDEGPLEDRLDHVEQRMMNDPVMIWRGADQTLFGIMDYKIRVLPVAVGLFCQLPLQAK